MKTLFLLPDTWDLTLDVSGNIAVATSTYQQAQDIASACRVFLKDMYYRQDEGIPYLEEVLGQAGFPLSLYKMYLEDAALSIDGVISAQAILNTNDGRNVTGSIIFTNSENQQGQISL